VKDVKLIMKWKWNIFKNERSFKEFYLVRINIAKQLKVLRHFQMTFLRNVNIKRKLHQLSLMNTHIQSIHARFNSLNKWLACLLLESARLSE